MTIESLMEQKKLERHNLLLDCKVQDLNITLLAGSLEDIMEVEVRSRPPSLVWLVHTNYLKQKYNLCSTTKYCDRLEKKICLTAGRK